MKYSKTINHIGFSNNGDEKFPKLPISLNVDLKKLAREYPDEYLSLYSLMLGNLCDILIPKLIFPSNIIETKDMVSFMEKKLLEFKNDDCGLNLSEIIYIYIV